MNPPDSRTHVLDHLAGWWASEERVLRTVGPQRKVAVTVPAALPSRPGPAPVQAPPSRPGPALPSRPRPFPSSVFSESVQEPREDGRGWGESDPVSPGRPAVGKGAEHPHV